MMKIDEVGIIDFKVSNESSVWVYIDAEEGLVVEIAEDDNSYKKFPITADTLFDAMREQYSIGEKRITWSDGVKLHRRVKELRRELKELMRNIEEDVAYQFKKGSDYED